jgi:hypothetical protein
MAEVQTSRPSSALKSPKLLVIGSGVSRVAGAVMRFCNTVVARLLHASGFSATTLADEGSCPAAARAVGQNPMAFAPAAVFTPAFRSLVV